MIGAEKGGFTLSQILGSVNKVPIIVFMCITNVIIENELERFMG